MVWPFPTPLSQPPVTAHPTDSSGDMAKRIHALVGWGPWDDAQMNRGFYTKAPGSSSATKFMLGLPIGTVVWGRLNDLFSLSGLCGLKVAQTVVSGLTLP